MNDAGLALDLHDRHVRAEREQRPGRAEEVARLQPGVEIVRQIV